MKLYITFTPPRTVSPWQPETEAYFLAIGIPFDTTVYYGSTAYEITGEGLWNAFDTCVVAIKTGLGLPTFVNNLSTRMKFWYPRIGGTATRHKYNAVDPTTFVGTYNGGFTHDGSGDTPNGTNGYFDTNCEYNGTNFVVSDQTFLAFIKTDKNALEADFSCLPPVNSQINLYSRVSGNMSTRCADNGINSTTAQGSSIGFQGVTRNLTTEYKQLKNGSIVATKTRSVNAMVGGFEIIQYAGGDAAAQLQYSTRKATHFIGMDGISDTEWTDINNAIQNLETALNR